MQFLATFGGTKGSSVPGVSLWAVKTERRKRWRGYPLSTLRWVPHGSSARLEAERIATPFS